jgi:hypothetical protein
LRGSEQGKGQNREREQGDSFVHDLSFWDAAVRTELRILNAKGLDV